MLQSSWSEAGSSNLSTHFYWPHRSPTQGAFLTSFLPFFIAFNPFPPSLPTFSPLRYKVPGWHIRSRRHSGYCVDMFTGASSTLSQGSCGLCLHVRACCWAHGVLIVAGEQGWGQSACRTLSLWYKYMDSTVDVSGVMGISSRACVCGGGWCRNTVGTH